MDISCHNVKKINSSVREIRNGLFVQNIWIITREGNFELSLFAKEKSSFEVNAFADWCKAFTDSLETKNKIRKEVVA